MSAFEFAKGISFGIRKQHGAQSGKRKSLDRYSVSYPHVSNSKAEGSNVFSKL